ncbi:MAG: hypothetical protein Q8Q17_01895 [bacterium]|nr:hypothetical protein [bacterium]
MNTTLKFAVAVLVAIAVLSGCGTLGGDFIKIGDEFVRYVGDRLNPNRPLPPQPQISAEVRKELATKTVQQIPVFIGSVDYYDGKKLIDKMSKKEQELNFTLEFPKLNNPSVEVAASANSFMQVFKTYLQDSGFKVVAQPCDACLRLDIDFAIAIVNADSLRPVTAILVRTRAYYGNIEVLKTRDDIPAVVRKPIARSEEAAANMAKALAATLATEELIQAWTIAIRGQQVSMAK